MPDVTTAYQHAKISASSETGALREKLFEGLAAVPVFAEAVHRSNRTVVNWIAQGLPVRHVGRTPYLVVDPARDWLLSRGGRRSAPSRPRLWDVETETQPAE
jgi:hypothetical protein